MRTTTGKNFADLARDDGPSAPPPGWLDEDPTRGERREREREDEGVLPTCVTYDIPKHRI